MTGIFSKCVITVLNSLPDDTCPDLISFFFPSTDLTLCFENCIHFVVC